MQFRQLVAVTSSSTAIVSAGMVGAPFTAGRGLLTPSRMLLDKSMFAAKRRVILPIHPNPSAHQSAIKAATTTDPLKISIKPKFASGYEAANEVIGSEGMLKGERGRRELEGRGDEEFNTLVEFVKGANNDQMISARRFNMAYEAFTRNDDVFVWLCHVAMSVLNPGDVRSRLIYRHLEALVKAVASGEMSKRTAFRFYESAIRSPAYRQIAARQLETGASTRIAGISAAADVMSKTGICRRPMTAYFELFQRITERSEANTPWGFPPLLQFEEKIQLPQRLKFFSRDNKMVLNRRRKALVTAGMTKKQGARHFWIPPVWNGGAPHFMYAGFSPQPKLKME
eukprot:Tbor_TRINITY_DN5346_c3_g2::TRINITY_DN5346_c3_g2_i1::g.4189::m.4189